MGSARAAEKHGGLDVKVHCSCVSARAGNCKALRGVPVQHNVVHESIMHDVFILKLEDLCAPRGCPLAGCVRQMLYILFIFVSLFL